MWSIGNIIGLSKWAKEGVTVVGYGYPICRQNDVERSSCLEVGLVETGHESMC
jgi:hypothetical protein